MQNRIQFLQNSIEEYTLQLQEWRNELEQLQRNEIVVAKERIQRNEIVVAKNDENVGKELTILLNNFSRETLHDARLYVERNLKLTTPYNAVAISNKQDDIKTLTHHIQSLDNDSFRHIFAMLKNEPDGGKFLVRFCSVAKNICDEDFWKYQVKEWYGINVSNSTDAKKVFRQKLDVNLNITIRNYVSQDKPFINNGFLQTYDRIYTKVEFPDKKFIVTYEQFNGSMHLSFYINTNIASDNHVKYIKDYNYSTNRATLLVSDKEFMNESVYEFLISLKNLGDIYSDETRRNQAIILITNLCKEYSNEKSDYYSNFKNYEDIFNKLNTCTPRPFQYYLDIVKEENIS